MNHLRLIAVLFAVANIATGATLPPQHPQNAMPWSATLKRAATKGFSIGGLPVIFEETTLGQIARSAAIGGVSHTGDAGSSVYWLCYTVLEPEPQRIWVISDGEMGGSEHAVTGIVASRLKDKRPQADCPALPDHLRAVSLDVPVWLGTSSSEVRIALGVPSHSDGAWREFDYQGKVPGKCEGGYDLLNSLSVELEKGRVKTIIANQVTSC